MHQKRSWIVCALFLIMALRPDSGAAKSDAASVRNNAFVCGTSTQHQQDAVARSRYRDSLATRRPGRIGGRNPLYALAAQTAAVPTDIGNVAVLQDDGTLQSEYNEFDLGGKSVTFSPAAAPGNYQVSMSPKVFSAGTGTVLNLADDDSKPVPLNPSFTFFGIRYSSVNVNSDGNLTFNAADVSSSARDLGRFAWGPPRIGPLFSDLDPGSDSVFYRRESDGVIIVWLNVPNFGISGANTFSVKLFDNGSIQFSYDVAISATEAVVGISPGGGNDPVSAADFSAIQAPEVLTATIVEVFTIHPGLMETAVARKFFLTHPDEFDQLVVFLTFPYDMQGAFSYELNVNNDVQGIGLDPVNDSLDYGSRTGRLKSFVLMGGLDQGVDGRTRFPADPYLKFMRTYNTVEVIAHEVGHRWLAFPYLRDGNVNTLSLLHTTDQSHWSFFFNADASLMEGNQIIDKGSSLGNLRFLTSEVTNKFSDLDLYLMGFRDARDVPPMFYVKNPTGTLGRTPNSLPDGGPNTFGGTRFDFTIDNIINGNGLRSPSALQSQKVHRLAFILVANSAYPASAEQVAKLQTIHDAFVPYFNQITSGQAWAVTDLQTSPATTPSNIYFPYFTGDSARYTGFAVANWGTTPADVLFRAFDNSGAEMSAPAGIVNPRMVTIPPLGQIAMVGEQIHQLDAAGVPRDGWIRAEASSSQITGFFMEGDIAENYLDGAAANANISNWLCFTRVRGTNSALSNVVTIVNPNDATANLTLRLFGANGVAQQAPLSLTLPGHGRIAKELPALFPAADSTFSGYATVTSDLGLIGYESFHGSVTAFSLPAQSSSAATTLYSAQFASGPPGGPSSPIRYFTDINVVNTSEQSRHISIRLIGNNGEPVPGIGPAEFDLGAGARRLARGEEIFGLQSAASATQITEGTLVFSVDGPGVIGDVTFGDPVAGSFMAALPLESTPRNFMVLSQVAEGTQGTGTAYFTGIAMYNPNPQPVTVTLDVYSAQGGHTGSGTVSIGAGGRLSQTLPQLVRGFGQQMRGYIRLSTSGGPVVSFGIFGEASSARFLAAIPPQPILQ